MAYVKQTWQTGEVITQEKLNHMEDGIGSCVMAVNEITDGGIKRLDKTWQEIHDAMAAGKFVLVNKANDPALYAWPVLDITSLDDEYSVDVIFQGASGLEVKRYTASSANGYPIFEGGVQ